jgi:hypothetical protein
MSQSLVKKWIDERIEKGMPELSREQIFALADFEKWLDTQRSPTLRAPVRTKQKCPACDGIGRMKFLWLTLQCSTCHGTGISNRSVGG